MSPSLRILHVIPSVSPKRGGPSEVVFPMVRALLDRGLRAEIATTDDDGPDVRDVAPHESISERGVPVRHFPRLSPPIRAVREYAYARTFRPWLQNHLGDYDLVHVHALFSHLSSTAMAVAGQTGVPYVSRPLGQLGRWPLQQSRWRKKLYYRLCEERHLRRAAALHFTSEAERIETLPLALPTRGIVIPHGMELPALIPEARHRLRAHWGLPARQKIALFLGRLHPKKGLDLLLPAFAALHDPTVTLLLAGEGEAAYERELDALIREHHLESRVIRAGFVSGEQKQLFLQGCDLFVLPSRHENFGVAVLEALAAGTPVLISDRVALADEIRAHRLGRVVPLEAEAVREELAGLRNGSPQPPPDELRAFVATHYSWRTNACALLELYTSILGTPAQTSLDNSRAAVVIGPRNDHERH